MPSMISFMRAPSMPMGATKGASARATGCAGCPAMRFATSVRHQASLVRATPTSLASSATSSTSRQKA